MKKQNSKRQPALPVPTKKMQRGPATNKLAQPQNRWQRTVRYVWDKKRG